MESSVNKFLLEIDLGLLEVRDIDFCKSQLMELEKDSGIDLEKIEKIKEKIKNKNELNFLEWLGL